MDKLKLNTGKLLSYFYVPQSQNFLIGIPGGSQITLGPYNVDILSPNIVIDFQANILAQTDQLITPGNGESISLTILRNDTEIVYERNFLFSGDTQGLDLTANFTDSIVITPGTKSISYTIFLSMLLLPPTTAQFSLNKLAISEITSPTVLEINASSISP